MRPLCFSQVVKHLKEIEEVENDVGSRDICLWVNRSAVLGELQVVYISQSILPCSSGARHSASAQTGLFQLAAGASFTKLTTKVIP